MLIGHAAFPHAVVVITMMAATLAALVFSSFLVTSTVLSPKKCPKTMLITTANTKIAAAKYPASSRRSYFGTFYFLLFQNDSPRPDGFRPRPDAQKRPA